MQERLQKLGLPEPAWGANPVTFWDIFGEQGHPVRATISDMGPLLLAQILELNDTQEGILNILFRVADDEGQLILDLDPLRFGELVRDVQEKEHVQAVHPAWHGGPHQRHHRHHLKVGHEANVVHREHIGRVGHGQSELIPGPLDRQHLVLHAERLGALCHSGDGAGGEAVIAAQDKREASALHGCRHRASDAPPHGNDTVDVFEPGVGDLTGLLDGHFDVAFIFEGVSQLFEFLMKVRVPYGAGTHIHPAAIRTKINWHTDNIYLHISLQLYFFNEFSYTIAPAIFGTIQSFICGLYDIIT